jgi:hypothetical protein
MIIYTEFAFAVYIFDKLRFYLKVSPVFIIFVERLLQNQPGFAASSMIEIKRRKIRTDRRGQDEA